MQTTSTAAPATGQRVASFSYGKGFLVFLLVFGAVLLSLAGFVLYLGTMLPHSAAGPVELTTSRGTTLNFSSPDLMIYATSAFLAVLGLGVLGLYVWQNRQRQTSYELFEDGIAHTTRGARTYVPFSEIQDVYLFSSGQVAYTGLITNLAFRRTASEPFHRVLPSLKGFPTFMETFRELYLNARQPVVLDTLHGGGSITFNCINSAHVWRKRMGGDFLHVDTQPIVVSRDAVLVQNSVVPMSTLRSMDHSTWNEKIEIRDAAGKVVLSTVATGILSLDVFLSTLGLLMESSVRGRPATVPAFA